MVAEATETWWWILIYDKAYFNQCAYVGLPHKCNYLPVYTVRYSRTLEIFSNTAVWNSKFRNFTVSLLTDWLMPNLRRCCTEFYWLLALHCHNQSGNIAFIIQHGPCKSYSILTCSFPYLSIRSLQMNLIGLNEAYSLVSDQNEPWNLNWRSHVGRGGGLCGLWPSYSQWLVLLLSSKRGFT